MSADRYPQVDGSRLSDPAVPGPVTGRLGSDTAAHPLDSTDQSTPRATTPVTAAQGAAVVHRAAQAKAAERAREAAVAEKADDVTRRYQSRA